MNPVGAANNFKIVLAGNEGVGKTSVIFWLIQRRFIEGFHATVGANVSDWTVNIRGTDYQTKLWDTAGQEKYRSLAPIYFRDAKAAVVVFDAKAKDPKKQIESWITTFTEATGPNSIVVIAANKCDVLSSEDRAEALMRISNLADELGVCGFLVSAKTGEGITQLFEGVTELILESAPYHHDTTAVYEENDSPCKC